MKRILITGANSYIGTSFETYMKQWSDDYIIDTVDMVDGTWREMNFRGYDSVFHVAGIAHSDSGKISDDKAKLYYKVNCDLSEEVAIKAKNEGVKQFIYMSSMIVYGASAPIGQTKVITRDTKPNPENAYGDSKLQAEYKLNPLRTEDFKIVILRPPVIYGQGSKGNYPILSKYAKKLPVFPDIGNQKSMLYIKNLCEFIRLMIVNEESGTYMPQNEEYVNIVDLVIFIRMLEKKSTFRIKKFNFALIRLSKLRVINKIWGGFIYDKSMSLYKQRYQLYNFNESIKKTELQGEIDE